MSKFDILGFIDQCLEDAENRRGELLTQIQSTRDAAKDGEDRTENLRRQLTNLSTAVLDMQALRGQFNERLKTTKIHNRGTLLGLLQDIQSDPDKYREMDLRSFKTRLGAEITMHKWRDVHEFEDGTYDHYFSGWMPGDEEDG